MRKLYWVLCAIFLGASPPVIGAEEVPIEDVRLLRVEGAAAGVRRSAERLEEISKKISNSNSLNSLPAVTTELSDLHRMVISARLAVHLATEELQRDQRSK